MQRGHSPEDNFTEDRRVQIPDAPLLPASSVCIPLIHIKGTCDS